MSNVISFLESVGQDAVLRHATKEELELSLNASQIDPALQEAILQGDQVQLEALLKVKSNVCCMVFPGKEEDEDEETPSKDDDEINDTFAVARRTASSG
jgi:hypothetical protein